MTKKENELQETIWRQAYMLRQGIRELFDSEDSYVHHCRRQAAVTELAETCKKQKTSERQLMTEVRNTQRILANLSGKLNGVLAKYQGDRQDYGIVFKETIEILEDQSTNDNGTTCVGMGCQDGKGDINE
jgi:hypothetical protein